MRLWNTLFKKKRNGGVGTAQIPERLDLDR